MTQDTAIGAIIVALMLGYYWARWRRAEATAKVAKAAVETAGRQAWRARGAIVIIGATLYVMLHLWLRSH